MAEEFEHILDECIERILQGESLDKCLQRYPQQAAQLEPLLQLAIATHQATSIEPKVEYKLQARQQLRSVLYGQTSQAQPGKIGLFDKVKSETNALMDIFRKRTVFQKALAGALVIALIVGLSLTIPSLFNQSDMALAEEIAVEDPGVKVLLDETGFDADTVRTTAIRSEDEDNIYFVNFIDPEDGSSIGTVTVDIKNKVVTRASFIQYVKELAERIAVEDLGVKVLLEETGFDVDTLRITAIRSADEDNTYFVKLIDPEDGSSIGTVTVDIKNKVVTNTSFIQYVKALAEEIAVEDPGVQVLLDETGLDTDMVRTTAVRSADEDNTYFVNLIDPKDGLSIGIVTVDIKSKAVTDVKLTDSSVQSLVP